VEHIASFPEEDGFQKEICKDRSDFGSGGEINSFNLKSILFQNLLEKTELFSLEDPLSLSFSSFLRKI